MIDLEAEWQGMAPVLRRFILRRVSDKALAEDILQEVFLKIQSRIGTLREQAKFRPWLYQICRNTIIDHYRSRKLMVELPPVLESEDEDQDGGLSEELNPCVKEMVDKLPERYRQAVYLTAYQGLTQKEMGLRLGISHSGAKSRVQRAREKLKQMLLECCSFELDRLGGGIGYEPRAGGGGSEIGDPSRVRPSLSNLRTGHG